MAARKPVFGGASTRGGVWLCSQAAAAAALVRACLSRVVLLWHMALRQRRQRRPQPPAAARGACCVVLVAAHTGRRQQRVSLPWCALRPHATHHTRAHVRVRVRVCGAAQCMYIFVQARGPTVNVVPVLCVALWCCAALWCPRAPAACGAHTRQPGAWGTRGGRSLCPLSASLVPTCLPACRVTHFTRGLATESKPQPSAPVGAVKGRRVSQVWSLRVMDRRRQLRCMSSPRACSQPDTSATTTACSLDALQRFRFQRRLSRGLRTLAACSQSAGARVWCHPVPRGAQVPEAGAADARHEAGRAARTHSIITGAGLVTQDGPTRPLPAADGAHLPAGVHCRGLRGRQCCRWAHGMRTATTCTRVCADSSSRGGACAARQHASRAARCSRPCVGPRVGVSACWEPALLHGLRLALQPPHASSKHTRPVAAWQLCVSMHAAAAAPASGVVGPVCRRPGAPGWSAAALSCQRSTLTLPTAPRLPLPLPLPPRARHAQQTRWCCQRRRPPPTARRRRQQQQPTPQRRPPLPGRLLAPPRSLWTTLMAACST
jgi:hypothetical protein